MNPKAAPTRHEITAWIFAAIALTGILHWHLLPSLLAGLLVYELTHVLSDRLPRAVWVSKRRKAISVALLASIVVLLVATGIFGLSALFRPENGSIPALMGKMAEIIEDFRNKLPEWMAANLPDNVDDVKTGIGHWLRAHAAELQSVGKEAGRTVAHLLIGLIIGALVALRKATETAGNGPLAVALKTQTEHFGDAFRRVVFAQVKISALNTVFTAIYLAVALPLFGVQLPLVKTLIAITFIVGLIPVLGNLISNAVIIVVSLSHSVEAAAASLAFLVVVHKLEYFLNARIVGAGVGARAWELLVAMIAMESVFGIPGVVAAPIYYAYLKGELMERGLV
ncbi:MAG: AI-2E family transporter [Actinomycetota bacterium]